jgi:hypothetical protein
MYLTLNFKNFDSADLIEHLEGNTQTLTTKSNKGKHGFYAFPEQTTFGFKQILRRVFCNGFYWENPNIETNNTEFCVESLSFFISTKEELDKMEDDDLIIVISISHKENNKKTETEYFKSIKNNLIEFNKKNSDKKNANKFFSNVLDFKLPKETLKAFNEIKTEKYDIKYIDSEYNKNYDISYSTVYGFYYYAFILQYRLERMQVEADVSGENFNENLIKQKTYLLNLNRFFLTTNRSEHQDIKAAANKAVEQFGLERKFDLRSKNIQLFEDLIIRKISVIDTYRSKLLKQAMTVVTFLGMPLVLISTLMGLDPHANVVNSFTSTVSNLKWVIILSFIPLVIITFLQVWRLVKSNFNN